MPACLSMDVYVLSLDQDDQNEVQHDFMCTIGIINGTTEILQSRQPKWGACDTTGGMGHQWHH